MRSARQRVNGNWLVSVRSSLSLFSDNRSPRYLHFFNGLYKPKVLEYDGNKKR